MKTPKYVILQFDNDIYTWVLRAGNGAELAKGGFFTRKRDAMRAINRSLKAAKDANQIEYVPYQPLKYTPGDWDF